MEMVRIINSRTELMFSEKGGDIYQIRSQISDYADRLSRYRASVFVCEFSQCAWYLYPAKTR